MAARAVAGIAVLLGLACGSGEPPLELALERGTNYFAIHVDRVDPGWANLFGYLHRRFGLELHDAAGAALHEVPLDQERPAIAAVFRRLVDPAAAVSVQQIAALDTATDRMTGLALHCDRVGLPPDWPEVLRRAAHAGGYALTHAALAAQWTLELGCRPEQEIAAVKRELVEGLVALASDRDALDGVVRAPTDLFLEAIVMLYYVGAGNRVEPAWIEAVLSLQRPDGGFGLRPGAAASDPHPTALALWILLENLRPEAPPIRWIP